MAAVINSIIVYVMFRPAGLCIYYCIIYCAVYYYIIVVVEKYIIWQTFGSETNQFSQTTRP